MMSNPEGTSSQQTRNLADQQHSNSFVPPWPYINSNGNFTSAEQAAHFLPLFPTPAATSNEQAQSPVNGHQSIFSDFNHPNCADLKHSSSVSQWQSIEEGSSTNGSPIEFQVGNGVTGHNAFYNHFIQDNYLSAMGVTATDSYPSTSFISAYGAGAYYPYQNSNTQNGSSAFSAAAMDSIMQGQQHHQQQMANSMLQWKYANTDKLNKSPPNQKPLSNTTFSTRAPNPPHKTGPGTNIRTDDKYRTVYTDRQRLELEKEFRSHNFVTTERKAILAGELQLTERQVKIWFQNRRAKHRKQEPSQRSLRMVGAFR